MKPIFHLAIPLLSSLFVASCKGNENVQSIRINQLGYYPSSPKIAVVADSEASSYKVIDEEGNIVVEGNLIDGGYWAASGETVKLADFSGLGTEGTFQLQVSNERSFPFEVSPNLYAEAAAAALKSFYFHRSEWILIQILQDPMSGRGIPCMIKSVYHPSSGKQSGKVSSIGGWYDAGDYGKYIVNAAVSVSTMLQLHELFPDVFADRTLNIPESGNGMSDLLDEMRFEIDWMLTMQDIDGGVFHKVTALGFEPMVMPDKVKDERYIIGKSANASVTFAGTLAKAYRAFETVDSSYAKQILAAAESAWTWAMAHPEALYAKNPEGVHTGGYNSADLSGEYFWAAVELLAATGDTTYRQYISDHPVKLRHQLEESWRTYYPYLAYYTLSIHPELFPELEATEQLLKLATAQVEALSTNPYRISIDHFVWGSNSDILNQAMLFQMAHYVNKDRSYLDASIQMVDYLFGKNAVGYSFLTGFGEHHSIHPHHRLAESDSVEGPIPGFVTGGPNHDRQDTYALAPRGKKYHSDFPAKCYLDELPSFASNEVCINWNAPAVFALGYLQGNLELLNSTQN